MLDARTLLLAALLPAFAHGLNDWTKPCVSGTCSYDTGDGVKSAYSSLLLNGAASTLSDITTAAGWQITGCSPTWSSGAQAVQITCTGTAAQMANCAHVLQGGAANKIVRLPEDCGTGPFARVAAATTKSARAHKASAAAAPATVHHLTLDYNFKAVPATKGKLTFSATSSNVKSNATLSSRNLLHRGRAKMMLPRFSKTESFNAPPIALSKDVNLFNQTIGCAAPESGGVGATGTLSVDVDVDLNAQVAFDVTVAGTILPPALTQLSLTTTMNGDASADFNVAAAVLGSFDSGSIPLFSLGLPGLSFPGILEIGPEFSINAQLNADLGVQASVKAGAKWTFPTVTMVFPPSAGKSSATANAGTDSPFDLSIGPSASIHGSLVGHLIPKVDLGFNVLDGLAQADIFLDMDISSTLALQVTASAGASKDAGNTAGVGGCATLDVGIDINAGATGAIEPIFDKTVQFDIFSKHANLVKKCFGDPAEQTAPSKRELALAPVRRSLACPGADELGALSKVI